MVKPLPSTLPGGCCSGDRKESATKVKRRTETYSTPYSVLPTSGIQRKSSLWPCHATHRWHREAERGGGGRTEEPPHKRARSQRKELLAKANSMALPLCAVGPPDAEGGQHLAHWPFTTNYLYNWKLQNPKCSEEPAKLIDLLDSVLFAHQPTWDDC